LKGLRQSIEEMNGTLVHTILLKASLCCTVLVSVQTIMNYLYLTYWTLWSFHLSSLHHFLIFWY